MSIDPPIFVAEDWDLSIFQTQAAVEWYFESWFPEERYHAWDGFGRRLILRPADRNTVTVALAPMGIGAPLGDKLIDLRDYLIAYLRRRGSTHVPTEASLQVLVHEAVDLDGFI